MTRIVCTVEAGADPSDFPQFPGGDDALALGCTCPEQRKEWWPNVVFDSGCPVHRIERVPT